jgi:hypothetical protein
LRGTRSPRAGNPDDRYRCFRRCASRDRKGDNAIMGSGLDHGGRCLGIAAILHAVTRALDAAILTPPPRADQSVFLSPRPRLHDDVG